MIVEDRGAGEGSEARHSNEDRMEKRIGVIGGSGLYEMEGLNVLDEVCLETPFGSPSDSFIIGELDGRPVAFLSRHGRGHTLSPSQVPYRANIYGFRLLGVRNLFSVSAVGSLRESIVPLQFLVPDQFVDRTRNRMATFFDEGVVAHVGLADPVCSRLAGLLVTAAETIGAAIHRGGTYLCIEGPQFSTRAESKLYRSWGMDVIGMTNLTEAKLAREAGVAYATLAMVCDYDCWHDGHADVTAEMAVANLRKSVENAQRVLREAINNLPTDAPSSCQGAVANAIMTSANSIPMDQRRRLALLLEPDAGEES